jgi:hypothetical protein
MPLARITDFSPSPQFSRVLHFTEFQTLLKCGRWCGLGGTALHRGTLPWPDPVPVCVDQKRVLIRQAGSQSGARCHIEKDSGRRER